MELPTLWMEVFGRGLCPAVDATQLLLLLRGRHWTGRKHFTEKAAKRRWEVAGAGKADAVAMSWAPSVHKKCVWKFLVNNKGYGETSEQKVWLVV